MTTTAAPTQTLTATAITILWSEAMFEENVEFLAEHVPGNLWATVDTYLAGLLAKYRGQGGGGYAKTKFRISWSDGETSEGRIDLGDGSQIRPKLGAHVRDSMSYAHRLSVEHFETFGKQHPYLSSPEAYVLFAQQYRTMD